MAGTLGTLLTLPRLQALYQGVFAAGAKLYFYEAGTTTPLNTYTSQALSVANANPLVADAYGLFGPVYVLDRAYKVVLKTSGDVEVWSQDNVKAESAPALARVDPAVCDARLTLTSNTPVTTSDVTAATTVYVTPYGGNKIALYSATYGWDIFEFSELSIALGADAASLPYDVFAYNNAGTVAVERLAWANGTGRNDLLDTQNGVLVKSTDPTRRYLGTYYTTAIGQTEDSLRRRLVWNWAKPVRRALRRLEDTNSWTYTTDTWRQANASALNQVDVVIGWAGSVVDLVASASAANTNTGVALGTAIGHNATNTPATGNVRQGVTTALANGFVSPIAKLSTTPAIGYSYFAWLEYSVPTGTTTWQGDGVAFAQSGITGEVSA